MRLSELADLIARLQDAAGDADPEVKLAVQPHYPFEWTVRDAVLVNLAESDQNDWDATAPEDRDGQARPEDRHMVYVVQGDNQEYFKGPVDLVFYG